MGDSCYGANLVVLRVLETKRSNYQGLNDAKTSIAIYFPLVSGFGVVYPVVGNGDIDHYSGIGKFKFQIWSSYPPSKVLFGEASVNGGVDAGLAKQPIQFFVDSIVSIVVFC